MHQDESCPARWSYGGCSVRTCTRNHEPHGQEHGSRAGRPEFTVSELRRVYEVVWGTNLDPRNFHRKATKTECFLIPTDHTTNRDGGRPARLYRAGSIKLLYPPLLQSTAT